MYVDIKSLYSTPETSIILYVSYTSINVIFFQIFQIKVKVALSTTLLTPLLCLHPFPKLLTVWSISLKLSFAVVSVVKYYSFVVCFHVSTKIHKGHIYLSILQICDHMTDTVL